MTPPKSFSPVHICVRSMKGYVHSEGTSRYVGTYPASKPAAEPLADKILKEYDFLVIDQEIIIIYVEIRSLQTKLQLR